MIALCLYAVATMPLAASSQEPEELPDAAEVLAKVQANYGDPARLAAIENRRLSGKASWGGLEGGGSFTSTFAGLRKAKIVTRYEAFGEVSCGSDGTIVWESSPVDVKLRGGWEACAQIRGFALSQQTDWRELYQKAECIGVESIGGTRCYKLSMTPRALSGHVDAALAAVPAPDVWYVDAERFLPTLVEVNATGLDGSPAIVRYALSDWKLVDGVRYHQRCEVTISGFTLVLEYERFEHDVELPEGFFEVGEAVAKAVRERSDEKRNGEVTLEVLEEKKVATIRATCKLADMQKTLAVILPEVVEFVISSGATMNGPAFVRYNSFGDELDFEGGVPIAGDPKPAGRVKVHTLPAGKAAWAWHRGPYEELGETHEKLMAYMKANSLEARSACWEEYLTDPGMEPDPKKWLTKVVYPVKEKVKEPKDKGEKGG